MASDVSSQHGEDGYLTFHGLQHHYLRWGDPGADPVVLLHGFFDHARSLEPIAAQLASEYCMYALDLRGHGETSHAPGGYLVWEFAKDLHAFVEELDLEVFDLVAIGMGCRIAMAYAREHSHRVKHLVLVEMGPEPTERATGVRRFATEAEALEHFAQRYPGHGADFHRRQLMASLDIDAASGELVFRFDPGLAEAREEAAPIEIPFLWESLEHITSPALVVRGEESEKLPRQTAQEMLSRLPNGQLAELPGRQQVPFGVTDAFCGVVRTFLAGA